MKHIARNAYAAPEAELYGITTEKGFALSQPYPGGEAEPFDTMSDNSDNFIY